MSKTELLSHDRVILCHFDDYSHALLFPKWAQGMLWPQALPEGAEPMDAPADEPAGHEAESLKQAVVQDTGLNPDELETVEDYQAWFQTPGGPLRVHLLRFNTPDAPKPAITALGGTFKALSELRGGAMAELLLLREAFTLVGGGKG
ncbi:MAG: hypothetical protein K0M73_17450 [Hydrogenophaga sp.]|nr:hypothetical protein [Hydrogenophaga sp.]